MTPIAWLAVIGVLWILAIVPVARRAMKWVSAILGKPPSFVYAATYFLCVPLFATIYGQFPNEFYYSTVRYEAALSQDRRAILDDLHGELVAECVRVNGSHVIESNGWELDVTRMRLEGLNYKDASVRFSLRLTLDHKQLGRMTTNTPDAAITMGSTTWIGGLHGDEGVHLERVLVTNHQNIPFDVTEVFKADTFGTVRKNEVLISPGLRRRIADFAGAHEGFPGQSAGGIGRMLHLSLVTITTLGYGDIVPISPKARAYTGLQAMLGVLLVGLFLNALSQEMSS